MGSNLEYWKTQKLEPDEEKLVRNIEEHGCHILLVGPDHPKWAYSVGLYDRFQHPEIIIFGLKPEVAQWMINELAARIQKGERFEDGATADGLLEGDYTCTTRTMADEWRDPLIGYATWFYRRGDVPVVQCLWPDMEARPPWSHDFDPKYAPLQPLLYVADGAEARMVEIVRMIESPDAGCECSQTVEDWQFDDDPHRGSFAQKHVADGTVPILLVCHDLEDGCWQFLDGADDPQDPVILCLHHLIELDPSLSELSDLPLGWQAWRSAPGEPWQRAPHPNQE